MKVIKYFHTFSEKHLEDRVELIENREAYMNVEYIKMFKEQLNSIKLDGKVAFLYAGGVGVHNSEGRNYEGKLEFTQPLLKDGLVIKNLQAYMMHRYIGMLVKNGNDITYANINSNTCASSLHSVYEAERLLNDNTVDYVIIVAEEKTSFNTIRIFKEYEIDVKPGEGFACLVLSNEKDGTQITDSKWEYSYSNNPFLVSPEGYKKVYTKTKEVKGHKTGTEQNDVSEKEVFGETFGYKDRIGHCQGASGLIEICMVLEENTKTNVLCVASGLGGFYGSCVVNKE